MTRKPVTWPIWKTVALTVGCTATAAALFWVAAILPPQADDEGHTPVLTMATLFIMLATIASMLSILGCIWLAIRIHRKRIPEWKRASHRHRRRKFGS